MCKYNTGSGVECAVSKHRLPKTVIPHHYDLRLSPDLAAAKYEGEVSIDVTVSEQSSSITLNASGTVGTEQNPNPDMLIHSATLTAADGTKHDGSVEIDAKNERITVKAPGTISKGEWKLTIKFSGTLNDKLKGFYRSRYKDSEGVEQTLACTQFESTDARRAFPCFDEPALKATFSVVMVIEEGLQTVSCTKIINTKSISGGKKEIEFAKSMKMPLYVLAFVVGKLEVSKPINVDGFDVSVWTVPGKQHLTPFSLDIARYSMQYFQKYFGRPYPGDKLDLLGIPDFAAGAMENLGCVTFREEALLLDLNHASQAALDRVAEVVAHEIAHMWFGDLVTMEWWDGLWLNEAFATFMAAKCVDSWKKEWGIWEKFALSRSVAMRTDALKATRPIQFKVDHPDEAAAMFDVLTYQKGCSVMRMLEQYLGEDAFQKGIALYMERHAYGNTTGDDLWKALTDASKVDVAALMDSWVYKPGFPVISVAAGSTASSITIKQRSFKFLAEAVDEKALWTIPVFVKAQTSKGLVEKKLLFSQHETTLDLGDSVEWVVVNAGGHSFVRVMYDAKLASGLTGSALSSLSVVERYNLLSDTWACVRAGLAHCSDFIAIAKLFGNETDPNVWLAIAGPLSGLRDTLPEANRASFAKMVRELLHPVYEKLGWKPQEGESVLSNELRSTIIYALADTGNDAGVQAEATRLYDSWKNDHASVDPNLVGTVVNICASKGGAALHEEFYQEFKKAGTPQDEKHFLNGMASFHHAEQLKTTLDFTLDPEKIRTQDAPFTVGAVMRNDAGTDLAWEFIKANWNKLVELYPESGLVRMCQSIAAIDEAALEKDAQAFFAAHEVPTGKKQIEQALEQIRISVLFKQRELAGLCSAFPA